MRLVAVTMHGPDTADLWTDAYRSVRFLVDGFMGRHPEGPVRDFSFERNTMLEMASDDGYDWALMLDTDERLAYPDTLPVYRLLKQTDADVIMVPHVSGTYAKERLFRLPARGHYRGRTHEAFILDDGARRITTDLLTFDEVPKTPEQYRAKVERDLALLEEQVRETPDDPRWWYYLGDTESGLGNLNAATEAFKRCWELNGWDEESAWAAYRIAEIAVDDERYDIAMAWCCDGMLRHPGMAELPWLAGWCCYQLGQYRKAIWWAMMAVAINTMHADQERIGFRSPPALFEAPWDVLRYAYRALGENEIADRAEQHFQQQMARRQGSAEPIPQATEKNPGT